MAKPVGYKTGDFNEKMLDDFMFSVQRQISDLIIARGIDHKTLASKLGVTPSRVSMFFREDSRLTLTSMLRVAEALNADVSIKFKARKETSFEAAANVAAKITKKHSEKSWWQGIAVVPDKTEGHAIQLRYASVKDKMGKWQQSIVPIKNMSRIDGVLIRLKVIHHQAEARSSST